MAIFEVYVLAEANRTARIENARFLKDRVSIFALIFPALWLIWNNLWLALVGYLIVAFAIGGLGSTDYAMAAFAFSFIPGVFVFLEGSNLIADKWRSMGFELIDVIEADTLETAELRWLARQGLSSDTPKTSVSPRSVSNTQLFPTEDRPSFGLFAED